MIMISTLEFLWQIDEKEERKVNNLELSVSCQDINGEDFNVNFVYLNIWPSFSTHASINVKYCTLI